MDEKRKIFGLGRNVFFTGMVSLLMDISSEMVYPLIPLFLTGMLGASLSAVGIIEGVAEATASLLKVVSGWLSDKLGRRKFLMAAGYAISAVSRPVTAGANTWFEVLTARFIDRFGKGIRTAPRDAIIADSTDRKNLGYAFGFHRAMDSVGAAIGPAVAFILMYVFLKDLRFVFYASAVPAALAVICILVFIKEKKRTSKESATARSLPLFTYSSIDGPFKRYIIVIAIFSLGNFADAFVILRAKDLGVASAIIPVIYLTINIIYAASSVPFGAMADRVGRKKMITISMIFYSAVFISLALAASPLAVWIIFPVYGIYKGMSTGTQSAYLAEIAPPDKKATAFGIYHTVVGLSLLPASIIAGFLWDSVSPASAFYYGAAMSLIAAMIFVFFGKKKADGAIY